jgi:hypothetical protein
LSVAGYIAPAGTALGLKEALAGLLAGAGRSDAHARLVTALAQHAHHTEPLAKGSQLFPLR